MVLKLLPQSPQLGKYLELFDDNSITDIASQSDHWMELQGRLTEPMVLREDSYTTSLYPGMKHLNWLLLNSTLFPHPIRHCSTHLVGQVMRQLFLSTLCTRIRHKQFTRLLEYVS